MKIFLALTIAMIGVLPVAYAADEANTASNQPSQEAQIKIESLQKKVEEQKKRISSMRNFAGGVTENSVQAPFGRFLLITNGKQCIAIQITEHIDVEVNNVTPKVAGKPKSLYRWLVQDDGSLDFSKPNVRKGEGELSEYKDGKWRGADSIKHGAFNLSWNWQGYQTDWIYFPIYQKDYQFAVTEWVRPEDIGKSAQIHWTSAR